MKRTRTARAELPIDVWDRLAAEAAAKGLSLGTHLRRLIVARDAKKHGSNQTGARPSTDAPSNTESESES